MWRKISFLALLMPAYAWGYIHTCFTPASLCRPQILAVINQAHTSIYVQAYRITSQPIVHALINAANRGVKVKIIIDRTAKRDAKFFVANEIPTFVDETVRIAHNKVLIVDDETLVTGSYNWTESAETKNAENVLITDDASAIRDYNGNFNYELSISTRLVKQ